MFDGLEKKIPGLLSRLRELVGKDPLVRDIRWKRRAGYGFAGRGRWIEFNDDESLDVGRMLEILAGSGALTTEHNDGDSAAYRLNEPFFDWLTTGSCGDAAPTVNQTTNILNIEQVSGSQIQQGTVGSARTSLHNDERSEQVANLRLEFAELDRETSRGNSIKLRSTYCEMPPPDAIPDLDRDHKETFANNMEVTVVVPSNKEYYRERAEYIFATKFYCPVRFLVTNAADGTAQNVRVEIAVIREDGVGVALQSEMPIQPVLDEVSTQQNRPAGREVVDRHAGQISIETHADKFKVVVECGTLQPKRSITSDVVFLGREESGQVKLAGLIYADNLTTPKSVELLADFTVARKEVSVMDLKMGYR